MAEGAAGESSTSTSTRNTDWIDKYVDRISNMRSGAVLPWYTEDNFPVDTLYVSYTFSALPEQKLKDFFSEYGPIQSISIHTPYRNTGKPFYYAFITFECFVSASKCLYSRRRLSSKFYIKPADTWHQRSYREGKPVDTKGKPKQEKGSGGEGSSSLDSSSAAESMTLLQLDDDCLMLILSHISILDLINTRKTCLRLEAICAQFLKGVKTYEFIERPANKHHYTLLEVRSIITEIGPYLTKLSVSHNIMPRQAKRFLNLIPKHCSQLQELQLLDFVLNGEIFQKFEKVLESLVSLKLSRCVVDDSIGKMLGHATCLERLELSFTSKLTGTCLRNVRNIKYMNLEACQNLQGQPFALFLTQNPTLEYLNISGCQRLSPKPFNKIHQTLVELKHLVCNSHYETVNAASLGNIAKLPKLKNLEIKHNMPGKIMKILESFEGGNVLEQLNLFGTHDSQLRYSVLQRLKNLHTLNLNYNSGFSSPDLDVIAGSGKFVELHLAGCGTLSQQTILDFIRANPELRVLDLSCQQLNESLLFSTVDILKEQASLKKSQRQLKLIVGATSICPVILENALIKSNRHLMKLVFITTPNIVPAPDYDSDDDFFDIDFDELDVDYDSMSDYDELDDDDLSFDEWRFSPVYF